MKYMNFADFHSDLILESRKERYFPIFVGVMPRDQAEVIIDKAISRLKREDAIMWYLRWYKYIALTAGWRKEKATPQQVKWMVEFVKEINKPENLPTEEWQGTQRDAFAKNLDVQVLEHFMSLPIKEIQNFRFKYQTPPRVVGDFTAWEQKWKKEIGTDAQWIDITEELRDGELVEVLKFKDGFSWFNLNRAYCKREGNAMGHCGNAGNPVASDTVLSLRKVKNQKGHILARPSLTFILNKETGALGEMKGRENNKPTRDYHPYIIQLLMHKIGNDYLIKELNGGGYAPEQNFSLDDLSDQERANLYQIRPELQPIIEVYERDGLTDDLKQRIKNKLPEAHRVNVLFTGGNRPHVYYRAYKNWSDAWDEFPSRECPKSLEGYKSFVEDGMGDYNDDYSPSQEELENLFELVCRDKRTSESTIAYVKSKNIDEDEVESIFNHLYENDDPIIDSLRIGAMSGHESGTNAAIVDAWFDGFTDLEINIDELESAEFSLTFEKPDKRYDSPVMQNWDVSEFIKAIDAGVKDFSNIITDYRCSIDGDMRVPHYGFDNFDKDYAIESFHNDFNPKG